MNNPPRSNLGPQSEPWARYQTDQTLQNARAIESMGGDASNDGRINNSAMDNMANQIKELQARQSGVTSVQDVDIPTFSTGSRSVTVTVQIPRPTVARAGWVSLQFTARNNTALQTEVYASFDVDGSVFHRDSRSVPTTNFEPASWNGDKAITGYTGFYAAPEQGGLLTMFIQAENTSSAASPRTISLVDIKASYQYGQRV